MGNEEIAFWMGVPLSKLPRSELEAALVQMARENANLRDELLASQTRGIRDLAEMARRANRSRIFA